MKRKTIVTAASFAGSITFLFSHFAIQRWSLQKFSISFLPNLGHLGVEILAPTVSTSSVNNIGRNPSSQEGVPTLLYTCLGDKSLARYQKYMWKSLEQARLINGLALRIVVISNRAGITQRDQELFESLNVTLVVYEDLQTSYVNSSALISEFRQRFYVQGVMTPDGNHQFNQFTTERLFAVHAYMNVSNATDVFHIENDNMLYIDLANLTQRIHRCRIYFGLTRASTSQMVLAFIYLRNASTIEHFLQFVLNIFRLNRTLAIDYLKTDWINDMSISSKYAQLFASTLKQSQATGVFLLPTSLVSANCCLCSIDDGNETVIFDARTLGRYFGGDFWEPDNAFWTKEELVDPRNHILLWKELRNGVQVPYILGFRIANLHVHSKRLERFSSSGRNRTTLNVKG